MKNGRCRFHGGKSTGARTKAGKERHRRAVTKHGLKAGPGNPVNIELYGSDAPGPRWPGHASRRKLAKTVDKLQGTLGEIEKLEE